MVLGRQEFVRMVASCLLVARYLVNFEFEVEALFLGENTRLTVWFLKMSSVCLLLFTCTSCFVLFLVKVSSHLPKDKQLTQLAAY